MEYNGFCKLPTNNYNTDCLWITEQTTLPYTTSEAASHQRHVSPGLGDFAVAVLVHDEGGGLSWGVNDKWVAVEPLQHDGVLHTQVVCRQTVRLPQQTLVWVRQVLKWHDTYINIFLMFISVYCVILACFIVILQHVLVLFFNVCLGTSVWFLMGIYPCIFISTYVIVCRD